MSKLTSDDIYPEFKKKSIPYPPAERLLAMLHDIGRPIITPQGVRFLTYAFGAGCSRTIPLNSPAIRLAAVAKYTQKHNHPPSKSDLHAAFQVFQTFANHDIHDVDLRFGPHSGNIHLDPAWTTGPTAGRHIEISPTGWTTRINYLDTVLPPTVAPQPILDPDLDTPSDPLAALDPLRRLLRLENNRPAWLRTLVWLLAAFRPPAANSPDNCAIPRDYPILNISGPAASGKTTAARFLRTLVDPSRAPINFTPSNEAQAGRLARDNQVVFIDGVTLLPRRPAEVLARLSTGLPAKFHGELRNLSRPILITSNTPDAAERLDSRALQLELPALASPLPQDQLQADFETHHPQILAALLTLLSIALRRLPSTPAPENSRFPEAVQWAAAALEQVDRNHLICVTQPENKFETQLSNFLLTHTGTWQGTATALTWDLGLTLSPRALSQKLSSLAYIEITRHHAKTKRTLTLTLPTPIGGNRRPSPPNPSFSDPPALLNDNSQQLSPAG